MHMLARGDVARGKTNDLVVAAHRLALRNGTGGYFVAGRNQALDGDAFNRGAAHQLGAGDQHVVVGVQADKGSGLGHINRTFLAATGPLWGNT
jgi:hypothetical protein